MALLLTITYVLNIQMGYASPSKTSMFQELFQLYKKNFNTMNFDLRNFLLKIWKSIKTPTHKMGAHLGV
jgi:hypothetical protein